MLIRKEEHSTISCCHLVYYHKREAVPQHRATEDCSLPGGAGFQTDTQNVNHLLSGNEIDLLYFCAVHGIA